jgi:hypothetical protein
MRHRIGMVLAVIMTAVLFFPGAWGYLRLLRLPRRRRGTAPAARLPRRPETVARSGRDGDDDLSAGVPGLQTAYGLGCLG